MKTIDITAGSAAYPVLIGEGALSKLPAFLRKMPRRPSKLLIVTDANVAQLHLEVLKNHISEFEPSVFICPAGEKAKTIEVFNNVMTFMLENGFDRKSMILAFGGGAVGDLAGFAAAAFMRGIRFIQVPTTILAHDSAVGGKTGINHPLGKNMVGAFHQPEAVYYDTSFLASLNESEKRSGFAEVIKHALIGDTLLYESLLSDVKDLKHVTIGQYETFLSKGIMVKANIVAEDEKEAGVRAHLNFGHTLGHAIEAGYGYGKVTHGEAVMIGMVFALELSIEYAGLNFDIDRFRNWINELGYRMDLMDGLSKEALINHMKRDKKAENGIIRFILLKNLGQPFVAEMGENDLSAALENFLNK